MSDGLTKLGEAARRARAAISPWQYITPRDVAGFAPGGGIVDAAKPYKEGLQKTAEATKAFREGRYGDAARWYGSGVLDTGAAALSALPEGGALTKLAMAVAPAVKAVAGSADEVADGAGAMRKMAGIRAFHGSPHDFDRFDMSKIGTGEGAQAYGHGLYFAENEGVAKNYREFLSSRANDLTDPGNLAASTVAHYGGVEEGKQSLRGLLKQIDKFPAAYKHNPGAREQAQKALELLESGAELPLQGGRMYEVRINADPEQFLDWDKPLSEQPRAAQEAIRSLPYGNEPWLEKSPSLMLGLEDARSTWMQREGMDTRGNQQHRANVSRDLAQAGVPGIKYLDAGSRGAGDGSRNYVVFDDKLVEIVKKYGWAPGMAIPAAMALEIQQAQEQSAPQM